MKGGVPRPKSELTNDPGVILLLTQSAQGKANQKSEFQAMLKTFNPDKLFATFVSHRPVSILAQGMDCQFSPLISILDKSPYHCIEVIWEVEHNP